MKRLLTFFTLFFAPYQIFGAFDLLETDLWPMPSSRHLSHCFQAVSNPTALNRNKTINFSTFYTSLYSIQELTFLGAGFTFPNRLGSSSICATQFGTSLYQERKIIFSQGISATEHLNLGFNLKGLFLKIENYGTDSTLGLDIALNMELDPHFEVTTLLWNMNRPSIGSRKENIPTGFSSALYWEPSSFLNLGLFLERITPDPFTLRTQISVPLQKFFTLEVGFKERPSQFSGGFHLKIQKTLLDYHYFQNSDLPGTHQFILTFQL